MKLAIVTSGFLPVPATKGGAVENLIVNLLNENELDKKLDVEILSIYDEKAQNESKKYKNTKFKFVKSNKILNFFDKTLFLIAKNILKKENSHSYRYIFQRLYFLNQVSKILKKENYDKVLLENHPTQYLALKWRKNYKKYIGKYYYHCHNEFPGTYGCENIILKTRKIICVSKYIAKKVSNDLNMDISRFEVLRNGIDTEKFQKILTLDQIESLRDKYKIKKNEKVLIFTGRVVPEKGIKELLAAIKLVKNNDFKLLIIGSALNGLKTKTKYQTEIESLIESIKDKVIFTGYINYSEIYKYYNISDIAVLPSIWDDPAPLTIIESLTCRLPIITTNSGGIPEYATDGSAIIIKRDENLVKNIASNIEKLLNNEEERLKMKNKCKQVSKELNIKNYFKNFCDCMEE